MGDPISIRVINMERAKQMFDDMRKRLQDPQPGLERIAIVGYKDVIDHFSKEMGPDTGWTPISPRSRKRDRGSQKILQDTGLLRASTNYRVRDNIAEVYNNCRYADYHEHQHEKYRRPPQRRFMWLSAEAIKKAVKLLGSFIVNGI